MLRKFLLGISPIPISTKGKNQPWYCLQSLSCLSFCGKDDIPASEPQTSLHCLLLLDGRRTFTEAQIFQFLDRPFSRKAHFFLIELGWFPRISLFFFIFKLTTVKWVLFCWSVLWVLTNVYIHGPTTTTRIQNSPVFPSNYTQQSHHPSPLAPGKTDLISNTTVSLLWNVI